MIEWIITGFGAAFSFLFLALLGNVFNLIKQMTRIADAVEMLKNLAVVEKFQASEGKIVPDSLLRAVTGTKQ